MVTVAAAFVLPVAVPRTEDVFAPAFVVLIFETVFQSQGVPDEGSSGNDFHATVDLYRSNGCFPVSPQTMAKKQPEGSGESSAVKVQD